MMNTNGETEDVRYLFSLPQDTPVIVEIEGSKDFQISTVLRESIEKGIGYPVKGNVYFEEFQYNQAEPLVSGERGWCFLMQEFRRETVWRQFLICEEAELNRVTGETEDVIRVYLYSESKRKIFWELSRSERVFFGKLEEELKRRYPYMSPEERKKEKWDALEHYRAAQRNNIDGTVKDVIGAVLSLSVQEDIKSRNVPLPTLPSKKLTTVKTKTNSKSKLIGSKLKANTRRKKGGGVMEHKPVSQGKKKKLNVDIDTDEDTHSADIDTDEDAHNEVISGDE